MTDATEVGKVGCLDAWMLGAAKGSGEGVDCFSHHQKTHTHKKQPNPGKAAK